MMNTDNVAKVLTTMDDAVNGMKTAGYILERAQSILEGLGNIAAEIWEELLMDPNPGEDDEVYGELMGEDVYDAVKIGELASVWSYQLGRLAYDLNEAKLGLSSAYCKGLEEKYRED